MATLRAGDLVGEQALFRDAPRPATAIAAIDVELLVLPAGRTAWWLRNRPRLMFEILRRLWESVAA